MFIHDDLSDHVTLTSDLQTEWRCSGLVVAK